MFYRGCQTLENNKSPWPNGLWLSSVFSCLETPVKHEARVFEILRHGLSHLNISFHISKLCASAFYHLHNIGRIRKFLSLDTTKALVHAFVTSRVDYCNSLLYGLPAIQINKVRRVLKAAVRLISSRATPLPCYTLFARVVLVTGQTAG